jgi:hypothetical protein
VLNLHSNGSYFRGTHFLRKIKSKKIGRNGGQFKNFKCKFFQKSSYYGKKHSQCGKLIYMQKILKCKFFLKKSSGYGKKHSLCGKLINKIGATLWYYNCNYISDQERLRLDKG